MMLPLVVVHGTGVASAETWPLQAADACDCDLRLGARAGSNPEDRQTSGALDADAAQILAAAGDGAHVVAQSYGALGAIRAAELSPATIVSLILFEPSAGTSSREGMNAAQSGTDAALSVGGEEMGGESQSLQSHVAADMRESQRRPLQQPSWDVALDPNVFAGVATLVVTRGSDPVDEAVADRIVELGGEKLVLRQNGDAVPGTAEVLQLIRDFTERVEARASG
jgi:pimeloyl-ACP methyl ester carboxylesterase